MKQISSSPWAGPRGDPSICKEVIARNSLQTDPTRSSPVRIIGVSNHGRRLRARRVVGSWIPAAFVIVLAAAMMDVVYMLIATFASSAIVLTLSGLISESAWFPLLFQIACVVVLVYLGISYLTPEKCEQQATVNEAREQKQEARARQMGHTSPFFVGLLIAVTNLASPTFLPSMIAFVGFLQANRWLGHTVVDNLLFSGGFGTGTTIWFVVVMRTLIHFRTRLSPSFITGIYRFAGGSMLLFAAVITYNVAVSTPWGSMLQ